VEGLLEAEKREELNIVLGIGNLQQLGYNEEEIPIYDVLFPFNISVIFLLILAIFTRYLGKPKIHRAKHRQGEGQQGKKGGKTEYSSDVGGIP
jgi:hypothetical protein